MSAVEIDALAFHRRVAGVVTAWQASVDKHTRDVDALLLTVGAADDQNPYAKNACTQIWLLGYEFTDTIFAITRDRTVYVLTSQKKANYLMPLTVDGQTNVVLLRRSKNADENAQLSKQLIDRLSASGNGKQLGVFLKDKPASAFLTEWNTALQASNVKFDLVDIAPLISLCTARKDETELKAVDMAAKMSSSIMRSYFMEEMLTMIDEEKSITHEQFTTKLENIVAENAIEDYAKKLRFPSNLDLGLIEYGYPPIIQSGGVYDLKPNAMSNEDILHAGTILCSLGIRYKSYCSNVSRTFLISPSKEQEKNYEFLIELYGYALTVLRAGVRTKDVYQKVANYVKSNRSDLDQHFVKNIGFAMGVEFRDSQYLLNGKIEREIPQHAIFNLSVGFQGLTKTSSDKRNTTYALLISDTVRVDEDRATVLTGDCTKDVNGVCFSFEEEGTQETAKAVKKEVKKVVKQPNNIAIVKNKTRVKEQPDRSAEMMRRTHQKELAKQRQEDGLARYSGEDGLTKSDNRPMFRKFESYRKDVNLPREVSSLKIFVDGRSSSVILPMYGYAVPFHISTIKNLSKSDEGEYVYLRINFITPGQTIGKKDETPFEDANAAFVRTLTYRSTDVGRMNDAYRQISDLKKNSIKAEAERKDKADIVEQDRLTEVKARPTTLQDVYARPTLDGKRLPGDLQVHKNGLRYVSRLRIDNKIDILFSNIQHLIFQPCDSELIVILHVHLKHPIMIGKKKAKDVQFYKEATDLQFDETGNRRRRQVYDDKDELEQEQEEKKKRMRLNLEFKNFGAFIVDQSDSPLTLDIPYRDLGFTGVPFRSNVLLQPTTDCLVHLTDSPFLIITLGEIEIAHLERIQFGLKNFDMVFVFKDFSRAPIHVNTIPQQQLDAVKEWLDSMDVPFSEGPVNLNWNAIMKTVNEDPAAFFEEGGWTFLQPGTDDENESASEESASEFEAGSNASEGSSSDSSAFSEESEEESASESDESGEDWDDLEAKARETDEKRKRADMDEANGRPVKKRK